MKVTVIGAAGGIGQALSLLLKLNLPVGSQLALYDVNKTTPGIAVDISHIPTSVAVTGYTGDLTPALEGADIVMLTATIGGLTAGADRSSLFDSNAGLVAKLAEAIAATCPKACIGVITNPVNSLLPVAAGALKKAGVYDERKLFGITTLDVERSETFFAEKTNKEPEDTKISVVGGHSEQTTVPLFSQPKESASLPAEDLRSLTSHIQRAYAEVVEAKAGGGSATLSMAQAAARFVISLVSALQGEKGIVECAYVEGDGQYARFFAQPLLLGAQGIDQYLPVGTLNDDETEAVEAAVRQLRQDIEMGESFVARQHS